RSALRAPPSSLRCSAPHDSAGKGHRLPLIRHLGVRVGRQPRLCKGLCGRGLRRELIEAPSSAGFMAARAARLND
ncbi:MAG: hypothetical protein ACK50K_08425, partial [Betaproteobacteria bacterium]